MNVNHYTQSPLSLDYSFCNTLRLLIYILINLISAVFSKLNTQKIKYIRTFYSLNENLKLIAMC